MNVKTLIVNTIPHADQRYDTLGDWLYDPDTGTIVVYTSDLGDPRMSMVCAMHELTEALLCIKDGVAQADVDQFDIDYEKARETEGQAPCGCFPTSDSEPGEDEHAPYRKQHAFADAFERHLALRLGLVWAHYCDRAEQVSDGYEVKA